MKWIKGAIALALAGAPMSAQAEWWEARTDHFVIVSEGSERDTTEFSRELERFDNALRVLQNMPVGEAVPDSAKVTVYRFGRTSDIGELAGSYGVAGFYIGRAARPVAFTPAKEDRRVSMQRVDSRTALNPQVVLFHEYTHHFMLRNFNGAYPSWYVEGFAELNSTIKLHDDGSFQVGAPANHRSAELFHMTQMPVSRLLDPANRIDTYEEVLSKYSLGWLMIHYLTFNKEREGQLARYLNAIAKGENGLEAATRVFGDLDKLDSEVQRYKTGKLPGIEVVPPDYSPPKVALRKLDPAEEKSMRERIRLARGVTRKDARSLDRDLWALAEAEPANYTAQILSAEAGLDAREFAHATAAAEGALKLSPDSVDALVYGARALIENPEGDPGRFAKARALLAKAHQIDPDDARPLIETYNSYRREGKGIPPEGTFALEDAFPLAAQDSTFRMILARQLIEEQRYEPARQVIGPLAYSYDGSDPKKDVASLVLAALEAKNYDEALGQLNRELRKREGDDES
jgi:cytochrome c-type biogenesis protein CcmH/NrfG